MTSFRIRHPARTFSRHLAALSLVAVAACTGDDFDSSQVPRITVTPVVAVPVVVFAWTPAGAQEIQVYRGTVADGNSTNIVWSIVGTSTNSLVSGVEYGTNPPAGGSTVVPAQALVPGQPYTVQINRVDPNNPGGSVSGSRYRYQNTQTFTLAATVTPP